MTSGKYSWKERAACLGWDVDLFFDRYEEDVAPFNVRKTVDALCESCPVKRVCFAIGSVIDQRAYFNYGVWGGVYLVEGVPDIEANSHRDVGKVYQGLVNE